MSTAAATINKKRLASGSDGSQCPAANKRPVKDSNAVNTSTAPTPACMASPSGVPGWTYPPLPMGMVPPMPYCMPGNPFLPFMGMFPPFWLPAAAMAAASMPALAAASAVGASAAAVPSLPGACAMPTAPVMWPVMGCTPVGPPVVAPPAVAPSVVVALPERACSAATSDIALPSTSCTNSVPTVGAVQAPASPPPLAASPLSVCNGSSEAPAEDDEFASFIDSFLRSGDGELTEAAISSGLKMFQPAGASSSGSGNDTDNTTDEEPCLTRSDSHSLLHLLGADMEVPGMC